MRLALLAVCVVAVCLVCVEAGKHRCTSENAADLYRKRLQSKGIKGLPKVSAELVKRTFDATAARQPIRFSYNDKLLDDPAYFCSQVGQDAPDFSGGRFGCADEKSLFTRQKREIYIKAVTASMAILTNVISVDSVATFTGGNLCHIDGITEADTTVVPNTDFRLYLTAGAADETNLGWAYTCATGENNRPVAGHVNMNPSHLVWVDGLPDEQQEPVETMVHEILHALGFSGSWVAEQFPKVNGAAPLKEKTLRGKTVTLVTSPEVKRVAREFFGCSTLEGVELEDGGSAGSKGAHWEKRILTREMMAASGGTQLSVFTLAFLKDSGHYDVDYSKAMSMVWGKNAGCGYVTEKCNTVSGGKGKYWCFENKDSCTADYRALGTCSFAEYFSPLPGYFQYFSNPSEGGYDEFTDYCPTLEPYSNRQCTLPQEMTTDDQIFGHFYGVGGRCFEVVDFIEDGYSSNAPIHGGCMRAYCHNKQVFVQVNHQVRGWVTIPCDASGAGGLVKVDTSATGYQGHIQCPAVDSFCDSELYALSPEASTTTASTIDPAKTDPPPTSSTASTTPSTAPPTKPGTDSTTPSTAPPTKPGTDSTTPSTTPPTKPGTDSTTPSTAPPTKPGTDSTTPSTAPPTTPSTTTPTATYKAKGQVMKVVLSGSLDTFDREQFQKATFDMINKKKPGLLTSPFQIHIIAEQEGSVVVEFQINADTSTTAATASTVYTQDVVPDSEYKKNVGLASFEGIAECKTYTADTCPATCTKVTAEGQENGCVNSCLGVSKDKCADTLGCAFYSECRPICQNFNEASCALHSHCVFVASRCQTHCNDFTEEQCSEAYQCAMFRDKCDRKAAHAAQLVKSFFEKGLPFVIATCGILLSTVAMILYFCCFRPSPKKDVNNMSVPMTEHYGHHHRHHSPKQVRQADHV